MRLNLSTSTLLDNDNLPIPMSNGEDKVDKLMPITTATENDVDARTLSKEEERCSLLREQPHPRWASRVEAKTVLSGEWRHHLCYICPCFRCVTLRWVHRPRCLCRKLRSRLFLGVDDAVRQRRLRCRCRPQQRVWKIWMCLCDSRPQWSREPICNDYTEEDDGEYPLETSETESDIDP